MNRYGLWRFIGCLPSPPEDAYRRDPDRAFIQLKKQLTENPSDGKILEELLGFALRFARLDELAADLSEEPWSSGGVLQRGRLRFYRALAESPDHPDHRLLDAAAIDFRLATDFPDTAAEAFAGLVRLHALAGDPSVAMRHLRRLTRSGSVDYRRAAAGALLFLSEGQGTPSTEQNRLRRRAYRLLGRPKDEASDLIRADIAIRSGQRDAAVSILERRAAAGSLEAEFELIRMEVDRIIETHDGAHFRSIEERMEAYRKKRPSDPRGYITEGNLFHAYDPETARMAWSSALAVDNHCPEAWFRLGEYYREAWGQLPKSEWLKASEDAYLKAVTLSPLEAQYRFALGVIDRESGRPGRAAATLKGGLAMVPEDLDAQRWLATCWTDLSYSEDLDSAARSVMADRGRAEWEILIRKDGASFDYYGLIRSMIAEGKKDADYDHAISRLLKSDPQLPAENLIDLAGNFIRNARFTDATRLLNAAERDIPENPRLIAYRARILSESDSQEALALYLRAAEGDGVEREEYVDWSIAAAELAVGRDENVENLLKAALDRYPDETALLRSLAGFMVDREGQDDAVKLYSNAVAAQPHNRDLLEEAVWFFREIGYGDLGGHLLTEALNRDSQDGGLWNQLGIHRMESGWDDDSNSVSREALESAIDAYTRAVEEDPDQQLYWGNLGDALRQAGEWSKAVYALKKAGDEPFALNTLARLEDERSYATEGSDSSAEDWESAGLHYKAAADKAENNPEYNREYAWWLYRERRLNESIQYYRRGAALAPEDDGLAYGEYTCWRDLGNESQALEALSRALESKPDDVGMTVDKADLLGSMGRLDEAEELYAQVLDRNENVPWVWTRLAEFREMLAFTDDPGFTFPRLRVDGFPDLGPDFLTGIPLTNSQHPRQQAALSAWEKASALQPEDKIIRGRLGLALMYNGRFGESRSILEASLIHGGAWEDAPVLQALARQDIAESGSSIDRAVFRLETAVEILPTAALLWADLGLAYAMGGRWGKSFDAYKATLSREPENPTILANAGIAALQSDGPEEAVRLLHRALEIGGDDAEWENALGLAHLTVGNHAQALEAFRSACLTDPENVEYPANLALAHETLHFPGGAIQ